MAEPMVREISQKHGIMNKCIMCGKMACTKDTKEIDGRMVCMNCWRRWVKRDEEVNRTEKGTTPNGIGQGSIGSLSPIEQGKGHKDKVKIEVIVDSGAVDHVIPEHAAPMKNVMPASIPKVNPPIFSTAFGSALSPLRK